MSDLAPDKEKLFERARRALPDDGPAEAGPHQQSVGSGFSRTVDSQTRAFFVPGRLEVLGKHTDYAGGRSLLCTVERGICLVAAPRDDDRVRIVDAQDRSTVTCRIDPDLSSSVGDWSNYPLTVVRRVARNFPGARRGVDIAFASDLPPAAGMSSSSALMIATFLAMADANSLDQTDAYRREIRNAEELAGYLATVENGQDFGTLTGERGVGTFGGSEDHTAMLCCRAGQLSEYSFCPVHYERSVPLSDRYVFVIGVSGVSAEKTGAARDRYNRASLATQRILALWREATGRDDRSLAAAVRSDAGASDRIRDILRHSADREFTPTLLLNRFDQFVEESDVLVPAVVDLFARGEVDRLGPLVDRSQDAAERLLGNQIAETVDLARSARTLGALAASAFGAGFGGSVWALVPAASSAEFTERWADEYRRRFPAVAAMSRFFATRAGPSARRVA